MMSDENNGTNDTTNHIVQKTIGTDGKLQLIFSARKLTFLYVTHRRFDVRIEFREGCEIMLTKKKG